MKQAPFKLRSGNKPSIAKMSGVSPMKSDYKSTARTIMASKRSSENYKNPDKEHLTRSFANFLLRRDFSKEDINQLFKSQGAGFVPYPKTKVMGVDFRK